MYDRQFMHHIREELGWEYSSFQCWEGRIKIISVGV